MSSSCYSSDYFWISCPICWIFYLFSFLITNPSVNESLKSKRYLLYWSSRISDGNSAPVSTMTRPSHTVLSCPLKEQFLKFKLQLMPLKAYLHNLIFLNKILIYYRNWKTQLFHIFLGRSKAAGKQKPDHSF